MTLRRRLFLVIGAVVAALIFVLSIASEQLLLKRSRQLEARIVEQHVARVSDVLAMNIDYLDRIAGDLGACDDSYEFVNEPSEEFVLNRLSANSFRELGVDLIVFVCSSGRRVFGQSYDSLSGELVKIPPGVLEHLVPGSPLLQHASGRSSVSGVLVVPQLPVLVASRPIVRSDGGGELRGAVIIGKYLDEGRVRGLSEKVHLRFTVCPWNFEHMSAEFRSARETLSSQRPVTISIGERDTIVGSTFVKDVYGKPGLILSVELVRDIYYQSVGSVRFTAGWLLLVAVVLTGATFFLLDHYVVGALADSVVMLKSGVQSVAAERSFQGRIEPHGTDEVAVLADSINEMLRVLEETHVKAERRKQELIQADKMVALGTLVSGVGHEINNPNSVVLMNASALGQFFEGLRPVLEERYEREGDFMVGFRRYSEVREEIPKMLAGIEASADRITDLVRELKNFARQEPGDFRDDVDLSNVVRSSMSLVEHQVRRVTSVFIMELEEGLPKVSGNFQRLEQVVVNLVQNACYALTDRSQGITVSTFHERATQSVAIEVRDEGRGISEEDLSRITDPFFTTRRGDGGTGLGLSVSSSIVKAHRGRLEFHSEPGKGTTVTLLVPEYQEDAHVGT